jgi:hypothetical protein
MRHLRQEVRRVRRVRRVRQRLLILRGQANLSSQMLQPA